MLIDRRCLSSADEDFMELYRDKIQWLVSMAKFIDLLDRWEQGISWAADKVSISSGIIEHSIENLENWKWNLQL
jgi:hypothetical protein